MVKQTTALFFGAFVLILLLIAGAIIGGELGYFSASLSNSLVLAAGPLATLVLAYGTLASLEHTKENFEELRRDRKGDEITRLIAIGLDPILESFLTHRDYWEKEPLHADKPILPPLNVTKIPESVSLSDLNREARRDSLRNSILDYFDNVSEYNEARHEVESKIERRLGKIPVSPNTIPSVSFSIKEQQVIVDRKSQLSNEILSNCDDYIDEVSVAKLVFLRESEEFSDDLESFSKMNEEMKIQNRELLSELVELREYLMDEYDLNNSEIMEYRAKNQSGRDTPTLTKVRREYSNVKPHKGR
jgi:hypothetical protein